MQHAAPEFEARCLVEDWIVQLWFLLDFVLIALYLRYIVFLPVRGVAYARSYEQESEFELLPALCD
jgi:hypothetical protein